MTAFPIISLRKGITTYRIHSFMKEEWIFQFSFLSFCIYLKNAPVGVLVLHPWNEVKEAACEEIERT
jgi:hypothetical protein